MDFKKIMKRPYLVMLVMLLGMQFAAASVWAQRVDDSWKNEKITLRVSKKPMGEVLNLVARQAGARIMFQDVTLEGLSQHTTLNVKDKPLHEVVKGLIGQQDVKISYDPGRTIRISPMAAPKKLDAQHLMISGIVYDDETKETLPGATILITDGRDPDDKMGCITDVDGKFSLRVNRKASIRVSFMGFEPQSMQILHSDNEMKISLKPSANGMDEVVVTGISKRSEDSFTGNYVTVKGDDLRKLNPNDFLSGLQFFDPSFRIIENNVAGSDPNAEPDFQVRGDQSLGGTTRDMNSMDLMLDNVSSRPNTPLFILDGFTVPMSRILQLDPQRIANVTLLKDAAATAIYGSRASNGVIVIETLVAPDGALSVSYNGNLTLQTPDLTDYNLMNASEKLQTEVMAGVYPESSNIMMNRYNQLLRNVLAGVNTYWLSQPLRTAVQNRHTLTAAGGTDVFRYTLGANASFSPGVMKGSSNDIKGVNLNMSYRKGKAVVGADINLAETSGENSPYGSFASYTRTNPYYMMNDTNGRYPQQLDTYIGVGSTPIQNPLYNSNIGIVDMTRNLNMSASLNVEYSILDNLRITEQLSYTRGVARAEKFLPADHTSFLTETDKTKRGSYTKNTGEMTSWSSNLGINYNLPVKKHLLSVFGNWTVNEDRSNYVNLSATGYPDPHMNDFIFGNQMNMNPSGTEALSRSMSLIGQVSYSYDMRYSADLNVSSEMSSRYSDHSMTPFWSTGLRWNAYREKWLEGRISNLVFRTSYGVTGEQGSDAYQAIEFYSYSGTMKPYPTFPMLGATMVGLANANLKWAKTKNFSVAMDLGVWKNRINATFEFYNNTTHQLITQLDLPPSTGFSSQSINAGKLQNRGIVATLNVIAFQNPRKQFYWTLTANATHNKNKILELSEYLKKINEAQLNNTGAPLPTLQEGTSTTTLYMVRSLGIDPVTGQEVFLTRDGKKTFKWDAVDKVPVGDTNPKVNGTFSSSINWRDFSCILGFTYKWGGVVYNQTLVDKIENSSIAYNLDRRAMTERWKNPGDLAHYKAISTTSANTPQSTRFLMKDNELYLATLNLGYRFKHSNYKFLNRVNVDVLGLNFTTNDLLRLSTVKRERGLSYPFARSYTMSLSIIFK